MPPTSASTEPGLFEQSKLIRRELMRLSDEALERQPFLKRQDAIGFTVLAVSVLAIAGAAVGYYYGVLPAWAVILSGAFFMAFLHDIEHDLLHRLYFQSRPWLYNTAMIIVWVLRPSTINPWVRREWHMHHHRASGTPSDIEERGLLNGERWGVRRAIMSLEPLLAVVLRPFTIKDMLVQYADAQKPSERKGAVVRNFFAHFPVGHVHAFLMYGFLGLHLTAWIHELQGTVWHMSAFSAAVMPGLDFLAVTVLLPNAWRTFCLYFVSSNLHYYGDIDPKNIVQQAQIWNAWFVFPLNLFCCNFGGTHFIHHFAVQYPFYMRLWIASDAHKVMRAHGARFNDFANMKRANRWYAPGTAPERKARETSARIVGAA
ncbi:MAG: hypothetical protein RL701_3429 [Pseudomonadota bacterium]